MTSILEYISRLLAQWKFWVIVPAWDVGIRTRLGKTVTKLEPGPHLRIPLLDEIVLVNTRQRVTSTPCVTLPGSRPGYSRVQSATISYRIVDPVRAVMHYSSMDNTIYCIVQAALAERREIGVLEATLRKEMGERGVAVEFLRLVEDVEVRTLRLLNENWRPGTGHGGDTTPGAIQRF